MIGSIFVGTVSVWTLLSAVGVVRASNLVHAVFWLASVLLGTAALFVALEATFIAGVQVVLYAGGVITLMLFVVMLTQHDPNTDVPNPAHRRGVGGLVAGLLFAALLVAIWRSPELASLQPMRGPQVSPQVIGAHILGPHVIAFEALSVLLLAAMLGAIVLARRSDP